MFNVRIYTKDNFSLEELANFVYFTPVQSEYIVETRGEGQVWLCCPRQNSEKLQVFVISAGKFDIMDFTSLDSLIQYMEDIDVSDIFRAEVDIEAKTLLDWD